LKAGYFADITSGSFKPSVSFRRSSYSQIYSSNRKAD